MDHSFHPVSRPTSPIVDGRGRGRGVLDRSRGRQQSFRVDTKPGASALLFLYKEVLGQPLPWLDDVERAKVPARLPVILTRKEVFATLHRLTGTHELVGRMLYGTGMRILEALRLRVKDIEFENRTIIVRDGKGGKDRVTVLPRTLMCALQNQMDAAFILHQRDLAEGLGSVYLPHALARKYPTADREWPWQYIFPPTVAREIRALGPNAGTTSASNRFKERCDRPCAMRDF